MRCARRICVKMSFALRAGRANHALLDLRKVRWKGRFCWLWGAWAMLGWRSLCRRCGQVRNQVGQCAGPAPARQGRQNLEKDPYHGVSVPAAARAGPVTTSCCDCRPPSAPHVVAQHSGNAVPQKLCGLDPCGDLQSSRGGPRALLLEAALAGARARCTAEFCECGAALPSRAFARSACSLAPARQAGGGVRRGPRGPRGCVARGPPARRGMFWGPGRGSV